MPLDDHESVQRLYKRFEDRCKENPEKYSVLSEIYLNPQTSEVGATVAALFSELCDFCLELLVLKLFNNLDRIEIMGKMGLTREKYERGLEECKKKIKKIAGCFPAYERMVADRI
jgi:hypothetical protein